MLADKGHMPRNILIVEDEQDVREALSTRLAKAGYAVKAVSTGKEAIAAFVEAYYERPFRCILLDVGLPDTSGLDVLRTIRQEEEIRGVDYEDGVKIIMQTGFREPWMEAFNQGCDDYIIKPYAFEDLVRKIKEKTGETPAEN